MKSKTCTICNKEKSLSEFYFRKDNNKYRTYCKDCWKKEDKKYQDNNKEQISQRKNNYYLKNKEKILKQKKQYRDNNKEKISKQKKDYNLKNKDKKKKYQKELRKTNINYKILGNLRTRIMAVLKGINKSKKTIQLLGCSVEFLKQHLQSKFSDGMNWKNYGKWHVDHRIPCASFDLSKPSEQEKCFHFSNLQPLWAMDNYKKGSKIFN